MSNYKDLHRAKPMNQPAKDPTRRFSDRVENYARYRPRYPQAVLHILQKETNFTPASVIADIGSGTGISAELFLENGNPVFAVEPNLEMRQAAETKLQNNPQFHSIIGTAEATTLPSQSVDYVVAAQAFHWFDLPQAKQEFARILKPGGWGVLMWNSRRTESTLFLRAYEALLQKYGTDYQSIRHKNIALKVLRTFFAAEQLELRTLDNKQQFDFEGLKGRLLSSSYAPNEDHPNFKPMLHELQRIFEQYAKQGSVCFEYDTEVYFGRLT